MPAGIALQAPTVCNISPYTVALITAGLCTLEATKPGVNQ